MVPQRGTYGDDPFPEPMVYSFINIIQSTHSRSSPTKQGENMWSPSTSPRRTEGLQTMGCGLVPQGDRLRHCYYYRSAIQPSARYLPPWRGQTRGLLASLCRNNPLQVIPFTPVNATNVTQNTGLHVTLRYG
jgi:hypothetical protein